MLTLNARRCQKKILWLFKDLKLGIAYIFVFGVKSFAKRFACLHTNRFFVCFMARGQKPSASLSPFLVRQLSTGQWFVFRGFNLFAHEKWYKMLAAVPN